MARPRAKGKKVYEEAADAWNHYVALKPPHPSIPLAKEMVLIFGEEGLNQPSSAVEVLQLIVASEPNNASYYGFLAEYAYLAGDDRLGDLSSAKAVSLAPVGQRVHLKTQLAEIKKQIHAKEVGHHGSTGGATATTPGGGTITRTVRQRRAPAAPAAGNERVEWPPGGGRPRASRLRAVSSTGRAGAS